MDTTPSDSQAIIRMVSAYGGYPFEAIDAEARALMRIAVLRVHPYHRSRLEMLVRMLECFLQISNQQVSKETLYGQGLVPVYRAFVGAIWSGRLVDRSMVWKRDTTTALNAILIELLSAEGGSRTFPLVTSPGVAVAPEVQICIDEYSRLPVSEEKLWLWRGWITQTRSGRPIGLQLFPLYARMGRQFTDQFFNVLDVYCRARRGNQLTGLNELANFIGEYSQECTPEAFRDAKFTTLFWREFLKYYMVTRFAGGSGPRISTLVSEWRKRVVAFVTRALEPSGLFAKPLGAFPSPKPKYVTGTRTNIRTTENGEEVKAKLITNIPLHVTDDEAMQLLFYQIQADHDVFVEWADWAANDIWHRHERQIALIPEGIVREDYQGRSEWRRKKGNRDRSWDIDRSNPKHLHNAAATFHHFGYQAQVRNGELRNVYPEPMGQTARELGLPVTDALYPYCIILVAEHPEITPSFLENLELFDRNGHRCGFVSTDGGPLLVGCKFRKGARLGEQKVALTQRTAAVVHQIVELTQSVRAYLRTQNNDDWRYLLLTCKRGFGYPARVADLSTTTSNRERIATFADSLGNTSMLPYEDRVALVRQFSLVALRSSAAVLVYLRTESVEAMAKALGHATYQHRLLSSYLPEPIAAFFRDRWIRLFQTGVVVQALEGSDFLLEATEFESMNQLDEFLHNHALKLLPPTLVGNQDVEPDCGNATGNGRVVFGVNTGILTALISLQAAVERSTRQVSAKAQYWAGIAGRLVAFIDSESTARPDLRGYLQKARLKMDPSAMEPIICG